MGEPGPLHRMVFAPVPSWVHRAGRAGCRGSRWRCAICFSSGCWERRSCRGPAAGLGCDRWSVYQVSALLRMLVFACEKTFLGLAAPSILPLLLLPPGSSPLGSGWASAHLRVKVQAGSLPQLLVLAHGKGWAQPCHPGNGSGRCLILGSQGAGQLQALLRWGLGQGQGWGGTGGAFTCSSSPQVGKGQRAAREGCAV